MSGQIPSSLQWERPNQRPTTVVPVDTLERLLTDWCTDNGRRLDVLTTGAGVAVTITEVADANIVRVFRGDTRADTITLATSWALNEGWTGT